MSMVTNILLSFSLIEVDVTTTGRDDYASCTPLNALQRFLDDQPLQQIDYMSGKKCLEAELWVAAVNYLNTEEFIEGVRSAPWRVPDSVQLFIKEQDDEIFHQVVA